MSNLKREHQVGMSVKILAGQTASEPFSAGGWAWGRVFLPAALTGTTMSIEVSSDGMTFVPAYDDSGTAMTLTVAVDQSHRLPDGAFPAHTMRLVMDQAQAADRVINYELIG